MANQMDPLVKRQKVDVVKARPKRTRRHIFAPYRTIGLVSPTNVPFAYVPLGDTTYQITTSVGRCLQTYDLRRGLNTVFITRPETPTDITATCAWRKAVFAAWGGAQPGEPQGVWVFNGMHRSGEVAVPRDFLEPIRQLVVFGTWLVGCGTTKVQVWKMGRQHDGAATYEEYTTIHSTPGAAKGANELSGGVCSMPTYLNKIFAGRADGWVEIWNVRTGRLLYTVLPPDRDAGAVVCMEPSPALDVLAVSYASGKLALHDVLTDRRVLLLDAGTDDAPVTSVSFRTDGLGAGADRKADGVMVTAARGSGDLAFWDLNDGGRIAGVLHGAHSPASRLTQRDGSAFVRGGINRVAFLPGQAILVTGGADNALRTWIFDDAAASSPVPRPLHARAGHAAPVARLHVVPMDLDDDEDGHRWVLSAGADRSLWGWSLRRDGKSAELSQGQIRKQARKHGILADLAAGRGPATALEELKAPEIIAIASSLNRDGGVGAMPGKQPVWQKGDGGGGRAKSKTKTTDAEVSAATGWESVVTAHRDDPFARTWFWGRKRAGRWALRTGDGANASTVAVTPCGTFALVGSEAGAIDMFNLQSGLHRRRFPSALTPAQARQAKMAQSRQLDATAQLQTAESSASKFAPGAGRHTAAVTGLVVDSLDRFVVSCALDGKVKFWDFSTGILVHELDWSVTCNPTAAKFHSPNGLVAFACDDAAVRVVDLDTRRTIRSFRLGGQRAGGISTTAAAVAAINDLTWSPDGRWVVVAHADGALRTWDMATGHLIDAVLLEQPAVSVAFSVAGDFLVTAPRGKLGVDLWSNRGLIRPVSTRPLDDADELDSVAGPTASGEVVVAGEIPEEEEEVDDPAAQEDYGLSRLSLADQLSPDLTTLSGVPRARWQALVHHDLIRQRNRPTEPPKAPEKAPFFLSAAQAVDAQKQQKTGDTAKAGSGGGESKLVTLDRARLQQSEVGKLLAAGAADGEYDAYISHLKALGPAATDLELRSLSADLVPRRRSLDDAADASELVHFVRAMTARLRSRRDYELVHAWMHVFLRVHAEAIMAGGGEDEEGEEEEEEEMLAAALRAWKTEEEKERKRLGDLISYLLGAVNFIRSPLT